MKPHLLLSPADKEGSGSNDPVKRLATRYNIPEKDVEALLYGSRAPKGEQEGSSIKDKPMPEDFRPNYSTPPPRGDRGWSPVNILSLVVGILGVLALTIILIAVIHNDGRHEREIMMRQHMMNMMPPPLMRQPPAPDTTKKSGISENTIPDESTPPPASENEMAKTKPASKSHHTAHSSSGYVTTNSLEAQEHLAEMRAEGNMKARVRQSAKNGMTIYTVK
jgi:hypothetical protein